MISGPRWPEQALADFADSNSSRDTHLAASLFKPCRSRLPGVQWVQLTLLGVMAMWRELVRSHSAPCFCSQVAGGKTPNLWWCNILVNVFFYLSSTPCFQILNLDYSSLVWLHVDINYTASPFRQGLCLPAYLSGITGAPVLTGASRINNNCCQSRAIWSHLLMKGSPKHECLLWPRNAGMQINYTVGFMWQVYRSSLCGQHTASWRWQLLCEMSV